MANWEPLRKGKLARKKSVCFCIFCFLVKTDFTHGPQRMVSSRHSFGVAQCHAWTASTISSMATSAAVGAPVELSCSEVQSYHRGQRDFSIEAQVAARQRSGESQRSPGRCTFAGGTIGESSFNSGEGDSAEIRGLQAALKEARRAAQDHPLAVQVEECQAFIQCSRRGWSVCRRNRSKNNNR